MAWAAWVVWTCKDIPSPLRGDGISVRIGAAARRSIRTVSGECGKAPLGGAFSLVAERSGFWVAEAAAGHAGHGTMRHGRELSGRSVPAARRSIRTVSGDCGRAPPGGAFSWVAKRSGFWSAFDRRGVARSHLGWLLRALSTPSHRMRSNDCNRIRTAAWDLTRFGHSARNTWHRADRSRRWLRRRRRGALETDPRGARSVAQQ